MNAIINVKPSKIKLITIPKIGQKVLYNNKSKGDLKSKINYIIKGELNNLLINEEENSNLTLFESKINPENNCDYNYKSNSNHEKNNILPNEKSTKTDDSSGEEKVNRKIQIQTPLNLTDKFNNSKNAFSNKKLNKYTLSLSLMNYITNKPCNNISKLIQEKAEEKKGNNNNYEIKKAIYYKDYNSKKEQKINLNKKTLTEIKFSEPKKERNNSEHNLYTKHTKNSQNFNTNENKKIFVKNKSYDFLKRLSLKNDDKNDKKIENEENNNKIKKEVNNKNKIENKEVCHYIKVNKKKINISEKENEKPIINVNKINKNNNQLINKFNNRNNNNENEIRKRKINNKNTINVTKKTNNTELISKKSKAKLSRFKKIEQRNNKINIPTNKSEQIREKNNNNLDKNKLEHNIFLDKTYQNRFKKKPKNKNNIQNDIFTSDKQKEYNTFIVKKKSNYFSNQIINSNSSSNSSKESNKGWVYRLYNQEIKKQKIKDKIILLLRKSILNEEKEKKKKLAKSKTVKQFKNYKYPINDGYNVDDNFNIINLFLSDDKKLKTKNLSKKKKKMKKCQSFHTYRNNQQRRYSFDDNKIEDEKIEKLIEDKIYLKNHRSYKKFRLLYNEELIDEEDEEKENDEEEIKI